MEEDSFPFRSADCIISDEEPVESFRADSWEQIETIDAEPRESFTPDLETFEVPELRENFDEFSDGGDLSYAPSTVEPTTNVAATENNSTVSSAVWGQMIASSFGQYRARHSDLAFPWESGVLADIFGGDKAVALPECVGYGDPLSQPSTSVSEVGTLKEHLVDLPHDAKYLKAVQSLKDVPYFESKDHKLELACGLWMDILSIDWSASEVGAYLAPALVRDGIGGEAVEILRASFGVNFHLLKRANTFKRFIQWHGKSGYGSINNCEPFPLREAAVWEYFISLRSIRMANQRGYTVPSSFLEAVRFGKFTLGLKQTDEILGSRRLLGFAALERKEKGPTSQAPGLEVEHVRRLHEILKEANNDIDRLGAGCFLICLYSRARWSDVRYIDHVEIDEGRHGTMTLYTLEHKTASVGLRREQYMPLVVPWEGIVNDEWIKMFMEVYQKCGLDLFKRPSPKSTGQFCARPLSTSEAANWLRALLEGTKNSGSFRSHSLKSLLIWSAKAGFDKETRAVLGHHCSALQGSDIVYPRHLQTRALRKLSVLVRRVRIGLDIEDEQMKEFGILQTTVAGTPVPFTPGMVKKNDRSSRCDCQ